MVNLPRLLFSLIFISVSACSLQYSAQLSEQALQGLSLKEKHRLDRSAAWRLHSGTTLFLTAPSVFNQYQYDHQLPFTRAAMHQAFIDALARAFPALNSSSSVWRLDQALQLARDAKAQILLMPSLQMVVNDQKTLSDYEAGQIDNPDLIYPLDTSVIRVAVYDVNSRALIDVVSIDSRGKLYKPANYTLTTFIGRAAMKFSKILSGKQLAPFG